MTFNWFLSPIRNRKLAEQKIRKNNQNSLKMMSSTATLVDEDFSIVTLKLNSADEVTEVQLTSSPKLEETTEMKDGVAVNPFNYVVSRLIHYFSL